MANRAFRVAQALLVLLAGAAVAERALHADTLQGTVRDPSGRVVSGVEVLLHEFDGGHTARAISDDAGDYVLPGLAAGTYWLVAGAAESQLASTERIQVSGNARHDIELSIAPREDSITVVGTAVPSGLVESAKSVAAVPGDDYRRRLKVSLVDGLRTMAGVRVQQLRTPGSMATVQVRGLRDQDTAVLVDGLRFRDASSVSGEATAFLSDLLYVDTERVELQRGASSTLYGTHAVGGVVDIRSAQGGGPTHAEVSGEGGGLGSARGLARLGGGLGRHQRLVYSGGISHWNVTRGVDGSDPYRNTSAQGFARFSLAPRLTLSGRVYGADTLLAINESPAVTDDVLANHGTGLAVPAIALAPNQVRAFSEGRDIEAGNATFVPDFNDPDSRRASSFYSAAVTLRYQISPDRSIRASYQQIDTGRRFRDGPGGVGSFEPLFSTDSRYEGRIDTLQVRADLSEGPYQTWTAGYEFERERYGNSNSNGAPDPDSLELTDASVQQSNQAAFVQDTLRWKDLQVVVAGRYQAFRLSSPSFTGQSNPYRDSPAAAPDSALTGDLSIAYFVPGTSTKLRAHGRSGYRAPASFERFGATFFQGAASFWGDPSLAPERSESYDAGLDQWLAGGKGRLSVSAYYSSIDDVVTFDFGVIDAGTDPWGRFGGYRNGTGLLSRGIEIDATMTPTRSTTLRGAYTYVNADSRTPTVPGTEFYKGLGISDHMFALTAIQTLGKRLDVVVDWSSVSSYPMRFFRVPGWLVFPGPVKVDVACTYRLPLEGSKSVDIYAKVENVLNRRYYEDANTAPQAWAIGGLRFRF